MGRPWNAHRDVLAPALPRGLGPLVLCLSRRRLADWNLGDCECPSAFWGTFWTRFFSTADFQNTGGKLMMTSFTERRVNKTSFPETEIREVLGRDAVYRRVNVWGVKQQSRLLPGQPPHEPWHFLYGAGAESSAFTVF